MNKSEVTSASVEYFNGDELAASVFVGKYALKDGEEYLEKTPHDMHARLANKFSESENKYPNPISCEEILESFANFKYIVPQGSPMSAIGNDFKVQSASNCFVIAAPEDSMGGIHRTDEELAQLEKRRAGVGTDISKIRPKGLATANAALTTDGIAVFMDRFSNTTREVAQGGRRGALMLSCSVHHPEIETFINIKKDKTKVTGANISVKLSDEFMEAVKNDTTYTQQWPVDSIFPKIIREVNARDIWNQIINAAWESAEPGILFWDNVLKNTPSDIYSAFGFSSISTNPCGEINLPADDSCRLITINTYSFVEDKFTPNAKFNYKKYNKYVYNAQRLMDDMIDIELDQVDKILAKIEKDPEPEDIKRVEKNLWMRIREKCANGRRTGLGITGLGDTLAALNIKYGSDESIVATEEIYKQLALNAYKSSIDMAEERGHFPIWNYDLEKDHEFIGRIISELPREYQRKYKKYGRRNIALTTTAPTGSVSTLTQTTSGIEPVFLLKYSRRKKINSSDANVKVDYVDNLGDKWQMFDVFHHGFKTWMEVNNKTWDDVEESPYFGATSAEIDWESSVKIQAVAQKWVCHSISKTCNLPSEATREVVASVYMKAWEEGCKGFTVYRDGCRDGVLVSQNTKAEVVVTKNNNAKKRPINLECDIHQVTISGEAWTILVGLDDETNEPYEIFGGKSSKISLPKKIKKGVTRKGHKNEEGNSIYDLVIGQGDDQIIVRDIVESFENPTQGDFTRAFSLMLRHEIAVHFIVDQMQKNKHSELYSFSRVIARVLKKYIKDGTKIKQKCTNCGSEELAYIEGCLTCSSCGNSRCG